MTNFRGRLFNGRLFAGRLFRGQVEQPPQPVVIYPGRGRSAPPRRERDRDEEALLFMLLR